MVHTALKNLLAAYRPTDPAEIGYKAEMVALLKDPKCFERAREAGHFTASAWFLNRTLDKALLMLHRKLGIWVQPGGHADGDANLLRVAIKETQEESGILHVVPYDGAIFDLDIHTIPARGSVPTHKHYDVRFLLRVDPSSKEEIIQNEESIDIRWFGKERAKLPVQDASVLRMFNKWLAMDL